MSVTDHMTVANTTISNSHISPYEREAYPALLTKVTDSPDLMVTAEGYQHDFKGDTREDRDEWRLTAGGLEGQTSGVGSELDGGV